MGPRLLKSLDKVLKYWITILTRKDLKANYRNTGHEKNLTI